ncbi:MAG: MMPL family transporter [Verrucomicrobia bacterium]|nr:MMPL family transporter [Verrucomicrobiota bacterium]
MKQPLRWAVWLAAFAILAMGVVRLRFDADVLNLLPEELNSVRGLKLHQAHFEGAAETLITLETDDETTAENAARSLAGQLRSIPERIASAEWQSPFLENPGALADLLAWMWLNRAPVEFGELTNRLAPERIDQRLEWIKETLSTTFSPNEIAQLGRDPFGLSQVGGGGLDSDVLEDSEHRSKDGRFRVIHVRSVAPLEDYHECAAWIDFLRVQLDEWRNTQPLSKGVSLGITGGPAFVAETALGMEDDMRKMTPMTAGAIALLFLLAHRRIKPLVWLLVLLAVALAVTTAFGGLLFSSLNAVSLGFAAIMLGVTVDYGLVLYQEFKGDPRAGPAGALKAVGSGVIWSAITTAAAFASLGLGSLPGLAQLGLLVAIGVSVGAFVILRFYLPFLSARSDPARWEAGATIVNPGGKHRRFDRFTLAMWVAAMVPLVILGVRGFPPISISSDPLKPVNSGAMSVSDQMVERMSGKRSPLILIVAGAGETELADCLTRLDARLRQVKESGSVSEFLLPNDLWSRESNRNRNAGAVAIINDWLPQIRKKAGEAGFSEDSLALTANMVAAWRRAANGGVFPESAEVSALLARAFSRSDAGWYALGLVYVNPLERKGIADALNGALAEGHVYVAGWDQLGAEVMAVVQGDALRIALPMFCVVLPMLWFAFRSLSELMFCLLTLIGAGTMLLATMSLFGWSWTLLNLPAIPLLLGLSVDYSIHMQMAMRRVGNHWMRAWRTTGVALALCALTTGIGFGGLALSHNQGLGDLGKVCATGVLSAWVMAVLVAPRLRATFRGPGSGADRSGGNASPKPAGPSRAYGAMAWKFGLSVVRLAPGPLLIRLGRCAGACYRMLQPGRERIVRANLLPLVGDCEERARTAARELFASFGQKIVELWQFEAGIPPTVRPHREKDWNRLTDAKKGGRGVLLVTPHLGNWEVGGPALTRRGERLLVLSNPEPGRGFTEIRKLGRARWGIDTLIVGDDPFAFVEVIKRLQDGGIVAMLMDRPGPTNGLEVELFGRPFYASIGAAELARATGCAVLPVAIVKEPTGNVLKMMPEITYLRAELRSLDARRQLTQKIMRDFEPLLSQYPEQWFQFIPIWPEPGSR